MRHWPATKTFVVSLEVFSVSTPALVRLMLDVPSVKPIEKRYPAEVPSGLSYSATDTSWPALRRNEIVFPNTGRNSVLPPAGRLTLSQRLSENKNKCLVCYSGNILSVVSQFAVGQTGTLSR